ncbi:hypothetical protein ACFXTH_027026 [Malus domestica]
MTKLVGPRLYSCRNCRNHVALHDDVILKAFQSQKLAGLLRQLRSSRLSGPDIFDRPIRLMKNSYAHIIIKIINHFNITCFVPHGINPLRLRDMLMQLENVIGDVSWLTILLSSVNSVDVEIAARHPKCRDVFVQRDVVYWLLSHLAFETVEVDSNHATSKTNSNVNGNEDPATKAEMKAMATRALAKLAKGNSAIVPSIAESSVLLILAVNLEKGTKYVQLQSAEALMEITAVAEEDAELRTSALYRNSPARKSIVDQLVIKFTDEKEDPELLIPCIKAVGNLATTC